MATGMPPPTQKPKSALKSKRNARRVTRTLHKLLLLSAQMFHARDADAVGARAHLERHLERPLYSLYLDVWLKESNSHRRATLARASNAPEGVELECDDISSWQLKCC